jgi:DNA-binding MarR family transcriptional regulator
VQPFDYQSPNTRYQVQQCCYIPVMTTPSELRGLGTLMRHVLDAMEADVAAVYTQRGIEDYRPRFSPLVRALRSRGAMSIRELADLIGVTHSAASQTVNQMQRRDLVRLTAGRDARRRIVHLTARTEALLPVIDAEWSATNAAVDDLNAELPMPLADLLTATAAALARRPLRERFGEPE